MKKSYFWGLLLAIMALIPAQNAFADYCTYSGTITRKDSYTTDFTITDGVNSKAVTNIQQNVGSNWFPRYNVYIDKTSEVFETSNGATLHFSSFNYSRNWAMYAYVYIDYNKDEVFDINGGELVAKTPGGTCKATDIPSWTIPADLETGTYRMRVKVEWDNTDPCGGVSLVNDGGTMCDMSINVVRGVPERTISVNVTPDGAGTVTGAGTAAGNITLTATPNSGYKFVNWTLNGEEVGTDVVFTDATEGNKTYVANFAIDPTLSRTDWSIYTVSSAYQGLDAGKYVKGEQAIDNDPSTYWHTDWDNSANLTVPQWIVFDLGSVQKFTSFSYAARTAEARGANGAIKTYKLYISETAPSLDDLTGSMTEVTSGEFIYPNATHMIDLDSEYSGQYVMLYATSTYGSTEPQDNQFANCAEFYLYYEPTAPMQERTITVVSEDENKGTVTGGGTGSEPIVISATANPGYRFLNWTVEGSVVSGTANYTDNTEGDKTYTANFVKVYNVTATATNGTVQVSGQNSEGTFDEGSNVTIEAVAANGYVFKNWVIDGGASGDTNPMTFPVTEDYEIEAVFEKTYFTDFGTSTRTYGDRYLTSIAFSDGVSANETITVNQPSTNGAQIYFDKTENAITLLSGTEITPTIAWTGYKMHGYLFVDWNNDKTFGNDLGANGVPNDGSELIAYTYYQGFDHTGVSVDTESDPAPQKMKPFTISSSIDAGEYRARFTIMWDNVNADATSDKANGMAVVDFTLRVTQPVPPTVYAVSVATADEAMGTAEVSATEVEEGTEVTFTATAAEGYQFVNWTSGEEVVSTENPYTVAVTAEMALTANFELIPVTKYTVTVNAGVGGTAEASATEVEEGQTVTLTATAEDGYAFANWTLSESVYYIQNYNTQKYLGYNTVNLAAVDGQTSDVTFTPSTMSEGDFTIFLTNATYNQEETPKQNSYMHCGSNGRFSGNSVNTSASQQIAIFKVEDPAAETIAATKVSEITSGATYMFVGLKSGVYYALTDELYEPNHATDQRMVGAVVTITDGTLTYTGDANVLWTIVNKSVVSTENPYTVTVTSNIDMTANFVEVPVVKYAVSAEANPVEAGSVTISATEVEENETVDLTATANEGYEFVNWTVAGTEVSTEASFTATVTAETAYVANFVAKEFKVTYKVDGEEYTTETYKFGETITPIAEPTKEGYTFSGWSTIPATMPAEDVEVTGTFTVNSYEIVYIVDGEEYTTETYEFGATITPIAEPTKEGYTFSGWSTIPATMPAEDVTVTGTFTEIIKEDVEVTDGNREENANAAYANVTVANEKVWDIKANTISADKVSVLVSATGAAPQIKIEDGGQVTAVLEVNRVVKKGEWAMMALPFAVDLANVTVDGVAAQSNVNIKVMVYDAAKRANESIELWTKSGWVDLQGTSIAANQGFAVAVNAQNGDEQTVTFASAPQTYDGTDKEVALDRHASTVNGGADADWNFFGNPTLANAEKGAGYALYIYNAEDDSYDEYASSDVIACQPYAAMFVQSADDFNTLGFSNGTAGILNDANGVFGEMQFSLNGDDEARIVLSDEASEEYVRNEDALYFAAPNANLAQLYIVKGNIKMAVSEQPELSESIALGYKAAKAGEQTLTLTSLPDNASVVLKDNVTGDEVALTVGDSYTFESAAGTFNNRFVVTTTDLTGIAQATTDGDIKVIVKGDEISVYGAEAGVEVVAYTTNGMVVASAVAAEGVTTLATSANGVIIVKVANAAVKVVK